LNYKNKSLEKTFEIIEALSETPLTPTELSKQIQINRSTLHRFLQNLEELRYLEKLSDNRMRLTQQFIRLGRLAEKHFDFIPIAKPFMKELADQIKESVLIASFNDFKIAYLDKIESLQTVRIVLEAGAEVPPHTVASGKLFLSDLDEKELTQYIERTTLHPFTKNTITDEYDLRKELEKIKNQDYAIDHEEYELGLKGFASPIRDANGNMIAALCVAGVSLRFDHQKTFETIELMKQYSNEISLQIGYQGNHTAFGGDHL
jgi:DNA-binding IclR family transcriptional regulator